MKIEPLSPDFIFHSIDLTLLYYDMKKLQWRLEWTSIYPRGNRRRHSYIDSIYARDLVQWWIFSDVFSYARPIDGGALFFLESSH